MEHRKSRAVSVLDAQRKVTRRAQTPINPSPIHPQHIEVFKYTLPVVIPLNITLFYTERGTAPGKYSDSNLTLIISRKAED